LNNRDFITDQNNRDYVFFHNQASLPQSERDAEEGTKRQSGVKEKYQL
jgi:hypothetical protein